MTLETVFVEGFIIAIVPDPKLAQYILLLVGLQHKLRGLFPTGIVAITELVAAFITDTLVPI
jgi:hypothetical protein